MTDINPYEPAGVYLNEGRVALHRNKRMLLAVFVGCFLITLWIPVVEYRQANYIHRLPLWMAYIGVFFEEYRVFALIYVTGHLAICSVLSITTVKLTEMVKGWRTVAVAELESVETVERLHEV